MATTSGPTPFAARSAGRACEGSLRPGRRVSQVTGDIKAGTTRHALGRGERPKDSSQIVGERTAEAESRTITLSAGARSQATNWATESTPARSHATPRRDKNSNHNFKLNAWARTVVGDRSMALR